jgi:hypothetical protein
MMLAALRGFLRARSAEAGYETALREIDEAVLQLRENGGHATSQHAGLHFNAKPPHQFR